jgi:hypothetical protein
VASSVVGFEGSFPEGVLASYGAAVIVAGDYYKNAISGLTQPKTEPLHHCHLFWLPFPTEKEAKIVVAVRDNLPGGEDLCDYFDTLNTVKRLTENNSRYFVFFDKEDFYLKTRCLKSTVAVFRH